MIADSLFSRLQYVHYRVTLVVAYLGRDDKQFGHSTVWSFLLGRGELGWIGWVAVSDGGT